MLMLVYTGTWVLCIGKYRVYITRELGLVFSGRECQHLGKVLDINLEGKGHHHHLTTEIYLYVGMNVPGLLGVFPPARSTGEIN